MKHVFGGVREPSAPAAICSITCNNSAGDDDPAPCGEPGEPLPVFTNPPEGEEDPLLAWPPFGSRQPVVVEVFPRRPRMRHRPMDGKCGNW